MPNRGEDHHCAKLTVAKVRAMRYLFWVKHIDSRCLSRLYGVSSGAAWDAVNYLTWAHVEDRFTQDQVTRVPTRGHHAEQAQKG